MTSILLICNMHIKVTAKKSIYREDERVEGGGTLNNVDLLSGNIKYAFGVDQHALKFFLKKRLLYTPVDLVDLIEGMGWPLSPL